MLSSWNEEETPRLALLIKAFVGITPHLMQVDVLHTSAAPRRHGSYNSMWHIAPCTDCVHPHVIILACLQNASKAEERAQSQMDSVVPIAAPQTSPCLAGFLGTTPAGAPQGSTPATAPRAANPAAFLRNTNSIYSPDVPAEVGTGQTRVSHDPARLTCMEDTIGMPT